METYDTPKYPIFTIKNFKQFRKPTKFTIKPLTLFVGPNGSGKSSIIQAINIFFYSIYTTFEKERVVAREYFNDLEFNEIISADSKTNTIQFNFDYSQTEWDGDINSFVFNSFQDAEVRLQLRNKLNKVIVDTIEVSNSDLQLMIYPNKIKELPDEYDFERTIQKIELTRDWTNFLKPESIHEHTFSDLMSHHYTYVQCKFKWKQKNIDDINNYIIEKIIGLLFIINPSFYSSAEEARFSSYEKEILSVLYNSNSDFFKEITVKKYRELLKTAFHIWNDYKYHLKNLTQEYSIDVNIDETRKDPPEFFELINEKFKTDYYGLANFLKEVYEAGPETDDWDYRDDLVAYLKEFEIANEIKMVKLFELKPNHHIYKIALIKNDSEFDIKNLSSGGKQLLPIILAMITSRQGLENNISIRQPELHIHPKLQMKLADLVLNISKNHEKLCSYIMIETHSEHIIRKFQYLIAKGDLNKEIISVFYTEPLVEKNESKIIEIPFSDRGMFTKPWPSGFFEERAVLNIQLIEEILKRKN